MRQWSCICGKLFCFGSDGPAECEACTHCGSNAYKNKPTPHMFVTRYNERTGKPYEICSVCRQKKSQIEGNGVVR